MIFYGLPTMTGEKKSSMRDLILSGVSCNILVQEEILNYCAADVIAFNVLVLAMAPEIDLVTALYRGAYSVGLS